MAERATGPAVEAKNPLTEKLKPHVDALQAAALEGDEGAQRVIALFQRHVKHPSDPDAFGQCDAAANAWLEARSVGAGS